MTLDVTMEQDLPPVEDLPRRLRVMAAFSDADLQLSLSPAYARQIAARLDGAAVLQRQLAERDTQMIGLRNLCVVWALWAIGNGIVAVALAVCLLVRG